MASFTLEGLENYEIMFSVVPKEELPEDVGAEDAFITPVLIGQNLKDNDECKEERERVLDILEQNENRLIEAAGSKYFKVIVKFRQAKTN